MRKSKYLGKEIIQSYSIILYLFLVNFIIIKENRSMQLYIFYHEQIKGRDQVK